MIDLLADTSVVASVAIAAAIVAVAMIVSRTTGRKPSIASWLVWIPAVVVALVLAGLDLRTYASVPDDLARWTVPVAAAGAGLAVAAGVTSSQVDPNGKRSRLDLGVVLAAAALGVFACVPETLALRALPGPVVIASLAALGGFVRAFGTIDAVVLATVLAWVAVVDGQSRPASIVGAAACIGAVGLIGLYRPVDGLGSASRWLQPSIIVAAILACSRLAGTLDSAPLAATIAIGVLALATGAILSTGPGSPLPAEATAGRPPPTG